METIDYYYSTRSSFAYLGAARIAALAAKYGRRLVHKPVLLSVILPPTGAQPFNVRPPHRTAYMRRDLQRCRCFSVGARIRITCIIMLDKINILQDKVNILL